jgi:DNA-binding NarL/FixJ family response regulator
MTIKVYLLDDHEVVRLGLRQLLESESDIEVAGEASFSDDEALFTAIMAGAAGYLLKQVSGTDLIGAVRQLAAGES